jgi:hypothetical protein
MAEINVQELKVIVTANIRQFEYEMDMAIEKVNKFKKALKLSLWQLIKLRIMKVMLPKPKITIQELIDNERNIQ